ncbi:MAG: SPOR domain-containing protein [Phaeodactylibacter sp.]|nr:SPOR domain-containing protein [Phaeodactylibacter sp.]
MEQIPFSLIIRLVLGLAAGFWLARKMRGFLRKLVVRLMPARYRVSEQSFHFQTKLSTALAFLVTFAVAIAIFLGLGKAEHRLQQQPWIKKEEATIVRPEPPEETMTPLSAIPDFPPPEKTLLPDDGLPADTPAHTPEEEEHPAAYEFTGEYYVQIFAFQEEERAWVQQRYWEKRLSRPIWIAIAPGEPVPYKVLIGPFSQRQEARQFLRSQKLEGFPREQQGLRLYKD